MIDIKCCLAFYHSGIVNW